MGTAGTNLGLASASGGDVTTPLDRALSLTSRSATSSLGQVAAYMGAFTAAMVALQKLPEPLKSAPLWQRGAFVSAPLLLALVFHTIPTLVEQRRRKRLTEITGHLQAGYFRLAPRDEDEETSFTRADGKHEEILQWLDRRPSSILYLTGLSGSGKSSLLAAWVLPKLERSGTLVIRLRGFQDPIAVLEKELRKPGVIWANPPQDEATIETLLERASQDIRPRRILVVLDQFEEFVILLDQEKHKRFKDFFSSLREKPISDLAFLLVFRSDYIGLIENLGMPLLDQNKNWREVPPFSESAAKDFLRSSGLQVSDELVRDVLHEAAEIEQTKGLIRPVTINLCGLVLGRFATGLPHGFRPGGLVRGFIRESVFLPPVREIAPLLIPHLISNYLTRRPRTITQLAEDSGVDPGQIRGCLRVLGQRERAIVRPLDADQKTWEISHDFLVPLLDSIVSRWIVSLWRRVRPWLPWAAAAILLALLLVVSNWKQDPVNELARLGWRVQRTGKDLRLDFSGPLPKGSVQALRRIEIPVNVTLGEATNDAASQLGDLKNLTTLNLSNSKVSDVSPLKDLKNLTTLNLSRSEVSDVSPLKNLKNLTTLDLSYSKVSDVSPLKDLENLTTLNLDFTAVSDVLPLKDLKNLTTLKLYPTAAAVSDVSPLKDLKGLTTLDLNSSKVSDVSPLKDLKNLTRLDLSSSKVSDVSPLKDLKNLTTLELGNSKVSDVSPLKDLKNLTRLVLSQTKVNNVSSLKGLKNLTILNLSRSEVSNVSPLKDLKNLTRLDLSQTEVSDVSPLKDLKKLTMLDLSYSNVSDVSPLKDLDNLTRIDLRNSKVSDVSPLKNLKNLSIIR
jgi:internalin A